MEQEDGRPLALVDEVQGGAVDLDAPRPEGVDALVDGQPVGAGQVPSSPPAIPAPGRQRNVAVVADQGSEVTVASRPSGST